MLLFINNSLTQRNDVLYARIPGVSTAPVACGFLLSYLLLVLVNGQGGTVASASDS